MQMRRGFSSGQELEGTRVERRRGRGNGRDPPVWAETHGALRGRFLCPIAGEQGLLSGGAA